jgi:hypothetical protein
MRVKYKEPSPTTPRALWPGRGQALKRAAAVPLERGRRGIIVRLINWNPLAGGKSSRDAVPELVGGGRRGSQDQRCSEWYVLDGFSVWAREFAVARKEAEAKASVRGCIVALRDKAGRTHALAQKLAALEKCFNKIKGGATGKAKLFAYQTGVGIR